jgi:hypothetical protein
MAATETIEQLARFDPRGPGTDGERRAARWLAQQLSSRGRQVRIETFWCRPNWALAHAWHVALAIAGSLLSVGQPRIGGALLLVALVSVIADAFSGLSPGRRLTPERASQNVVASSHEPHPVRLILTAEYHAPRVGFVQRDPIRTIAVRAREAARATTPGWLGWLSVALAWLLAIAIVRLTGHKSTAVGIAQLVPTVALVLTFAALIDIAIADYAPTSNENASGTAVALALAKALDAAPPSRMAVEVVLQGAGDGIGLRAHLRKRKLRPSDAITLALAPAGAGEPRWWVSDGRLIPLRYFRRLRDLAATTANSEPQLNARPHHGRGATPAFPARLARLPAIAIGCLDRTGLVPKRTDPRALDAALQFGLMLVDAIDASLSGAEQAPHPTATPA